MLDFELTIPPKIVFGVGSVERLGVEARAMGTRVLLVTGANPLRAQRAKASLKTAGLPVETFEVENEPMVEDIHRGVEALHEEDCDLVIGVGGGSVLDAAKAIAAMAANPGGLMDYLEVIGQGNPLTQDPLPVIAVPTTAGTGAEATRNAVITSPEMEVKVSLRHPRMVPKLALLDPELTLTLPPERTAACGMDAVCQLMEAFTCRTPNPFTDALCREGLKRSSRSLVKAFADGSDIEARSDMMLAAHFSGIALANARLGAVHGFAAPLGGRCGAAHGALCATLLPAVLIVNLEAMRHREPANPAVVRYQEAARLFTGRPGARVEEIAEYAEQLRQEFRIPRLMEYGISEEDFEGLCAKAAQAGSMKGNPVTLTPRELRKILEMAY
jgi:alcohol dehydrogenase class IV